MSDPLDFTEPGADQPATAEPAAQPVATEPATEPATVPDAETGTGNGTGEAATDGDGAWDGEGGAGEVVDAEELIAERPPRESPYDRPGNWYVVHTQSGYEKKVKSNLESRIVSMDMEDSIFEVVIPMEDVIEFKGGKKVVVQKKVFPGYLYVRCYLDDRSWEVIRNTPGVTGFVGTGGKPMPLTRRDVEMALSVPEETEDDAAAPKRGRPRLEYEVGETVRIKEGAFADFTGEIAEINEDQLNLKVLVNIFGRETPITIEFSHVAKL